ncbi:Cytochrome C oxidase, cbb3-type, subunit III [Nitrosospira briensis]|uniref:Cytochrome C oxidase, cbb3-type, subunit III n=1 Tax=Nitrosospira briensis TaxID=35799 RepID=A0A1I4Z7U4_9PROT|nr:cytochrome c [Nitrosospira briensis]SFN46371.1 Cytochrome C oxidase, cbb3-type, subunit III [Nitrosospira briensis]
MRKTAPGAGAIGFMLVIVIAIAAATMTKAAFAAPPAPNGGFVWKDGPEVYTKVCGYCHEQGVGPVIRGRALPPVYIRNVVRNGSRAMPSFRIAEIDDESLTKLAEYISAN